MMGTNRSRTPAVIALVLANLFWAVNYVVGAAAISQFSPLELTASRWVLAAVPLLLLAQLIEKPDWRRVPRALPKLLALALVGVAGYNLLLYTALQYTTSSSASLINAANPGLLLVASALLGRATLTRGSVGGLLLGLVGVLLVLFGGGVEGVNGFGLGEILMLVAIAAWTVYSLAGPWAPDLPPITSTAVQATLVAVVFAPLALLFPGPAADGVDADGIIASIVIAALPSIGSYVLWNSALRTIPAAQAGVFLNLLAVFVVLISAFLGVIPAPLELLGGALVLIGVFVSQRTARPAKG